MPTPGTSASARSSSAASPLTVPTWVVPVAIVVDSPLRSPATTWVSACRAVAPRPSTSLDSDQQLVGRGVDRGHGRLVARPRQLGPRRGPGQVVPRGDDPGPAERDQQRGGEPGDRRRTRVRMTLHGPERSRSAPRRPWSGRRDRSAGSGSCSASGFATWARPPSIGRGSNPKADRTESSGPMLSNLSWRSWSVATGNGRRTNSADARDEADQRDRHRDEDPPLPHGPKDLLDDLPVGPVARPAERVLATDGRVVGRPRSRSRRPGRRSPAAGTARRPCR